MCLHQEVITWKSIAKAFESSRGQRLKLFYLGFLPNDSKVSPKHVNVIVNFFYMTNAKLQLTRKKTLEVVCYRAENAENDFILEHATADFDIMIVVILSPFWIPVCSDLFVCIFQYSSVLLLYFT